MGDADGGEGVAAQQKLGIRAAFDLAQGILLVRAAGGPSGGGAYMARMRALSVCVHLQAVTFSAPSSEQGVTPERERMERVEGRTQCCVAACDGAARLPHQQSHAWPAHRPDVLPCHS